MPGRLRHLVGWVWLPALAAALAVFAIGERFHYSALARFDPPTRPDGWTAAGWRLALAERGVSGELYAALRVAGDTLFVPVFVVDCQSDLVPSDRPTGGPHRTISDSVRRGVDS